MTKHVIEINGQKYDAKTGKPLAHSASTQTAPVSHPKTHASQHIDGFTRRPATAVKKAPQKSQTLMRASVKQPVAHKIHAKAIAKPSQSPARHQAPRTESIKPGRAIRATTIAQSNLISKFGHSTPAIQTANVPVAPEPTLLQHNKPAVEPVPAHVPAAKHPASSHDPFKTAVENAISHQQPKAKKARVHHRIAKKLHVSPGLVSFSGMIILALGVGGFLAYQNLPKIAMQVAATRAGLNASMPTYQPSGFSMAGPIEYEPGVVTLNFKSNSDERSFAVTQKNSSWNSETLLENFVSATKQPYQTFQANGRTIYIYEGNKATWVDGGVWFNIDGKANLNSDQLLRIADSL